MSPWGWRPERTQGIWRHGPLWLKPLVAVSPWAGAVVCALLMYVVGDTLTTAKGVLFDLPDAGFAEGADTSLVALAIPLRNETTVFFDDARYAIDDGTSAAVLREHLSDRIAKAPHKNLLVLSDRRIPSGDLMRLVAIAHDSGAEKVLLADKHVKEARNE